MKNAITYLLVFIAIQVGIGAVVPLVWQLFSPGHDVTALQLTVTLVVVDVVTIVLFLLARWAVVSPAYLRSRPWMTFFWALLAALGALIPSAWLQEQLPDLPNVAEDQFKMLLGTPIGYAAIGVMAPLCEELVFRGAILRTLLGSWKQRPWLAIAVSAVMFAVIHFNPAQMLHPLLIGLLLGWMYYRTDSILPGVVYHWVNNTAAFVVYRFYPNSDLKLVDYFGGSEPHVWMALLFSLCIFVPAVFQLNVWMQKAKYTVEWDA